MKQSNINFTSLILLLMLAAIVPIILTIDYPDKAILILSDDDFDNYDFSGTGTAEDPFLIEDLKITKEPKGEYMFAIKIFNTSKYFVIQNCRIEEYHGGIDLDQNANGTAKIINNYIYKCDSFGGLDVDDSNHVTIANNTIIQSDFALSLSRSDNSTIWNNTIYRNHVGIDIRNSNFVEISKNNCSENKWGLVNRDSNYTNIAENHFFKSSYWWEVDPLNVGTGIEIRDGYHLMILNNTISENNRYGIDAINLHLSIISFNNISYNYIAVNHGYGIKFVDSNDNNITYNLIEENREYGIYLEHSRDNIIHHNAFIQNGNQVTANAFSLDNSNNTWFDITTLEGNFWMGWNTSIPYAIQGETTEDPYPLEVNPVELELYFIVNEK
ncbi:MAG: right-handed parallel beta-helix repeat-containing protein [Candidatus Heimdallarchaeaceae archaeon]